MSTSLRRRVHGKETVETDENQLSDNPMAHRGQSSLRAFRSQLASLLSPAELKWTSLQPYLQRLGYILRPRYNPEFIPTPGGYLDPSVFRVRLLMFVVVAANFKLNPDRQRHGRL
jgi:hypothetical protein